MDKYAKYSDDDLLDLIVEGDMKAFEILYDRYSAKVFKKCYFFCLNDEQAKDMTQDVWINVFFHVKDFKRNSSFSTWLYRITTNGCINWMKKKSGTELSLDCDQIEVPYKNGLEVSAEARQVLSILSGEDRLLLTMKYMDELTYEEISEKLGISASAVKMRLSRLMGSLRKKLSK